VIIMEKSRNSDGVYETSREFGFIGDSKKRVNQGFLEAYKLPLAAWVGTNVGDTATTAYGLDWSPKHPEATASPDSYTAWMRERLKESLDSNYNPDSGTSYYAGASYQTAGQIHEGNAYGAYFMDHFGALEGSILFKAAIVGGIALGAYGLDKLLRRKGGKRSKIVTGTIYGLSGWVALAVINNSLVLHDLGALPF
jgi:hypothetical protein